MTIIILLILTGLILLILEFFVFPGISISGIGGVISVVLAVYFGYSRYGSTTGTVILISAVIAFIILVLIALRSKTWKRFSLDTVVEGQVETVEENLVKRGDKGVTITRLNPVGKARINDKEVEAQCPGKYVDPKTEIEVVKVFKNYIVVKPLNQ